MVAIITPIIAALITGFAGYKMYILKKDEENKKHTELLSSNEKIKDGIIENQSQVQLEKDKQFALIYQTEISHFFSKYRTCLHWTLPLDENTDKEIDSVFSYGVNLAKGFDLNSISKPIIIKTFREYNFRNIMPNFIGNENFHPTGFSNLLGILEYLENQLEEHLGKYGGAISIELSTKAEYLQRMISSTTSSIRLDKVTNETTSMQTIEIIADLILLLVEDTNFLHQEYTKDVVGGYPIVVGTVTKSHDTDGEMVVETQFSNY